MAGLFLAVKSPIANPKSFVSRHPQPVTRRRIAIAAEEEVAEGDVAQGPGQGPRP